MLFDKWKIVGDFAYRYCLTNPLIKCQVRIDGPVYGKWYWEFGPARGWVNTVKEAMNKCDEFIGWGVCRLSPTVFKEVEKFPLTKALLFRWEIWDKYKQLDS